MVYLPFIHICFYEKQYLTIILKEKIYPKYINEINQIFCLTLKL